MQDLEHQYHVHKFGGTSVANMERFVELKSLLTGKNEIIVVSATQDTTATLQTMIDAAKSKSPYLPILFEVNQSDVKVYNLVPEELKSCTVDAFLERLPAYDQQMERLVSKAIAENKKIGYAGTINDTGKVRVAIESFSLEHPFSRLHGSDNMLVFYTKRYHDQPLVIQGPGAGTEVTAAGIFADLLRLVSFLS